MKNTGKQWKMPRQYSMVKCIFSNDLFSKEKTYVFLGEIPNMPGHCVVVEYSDKAAKVFTGYHCDNFIELAKDEV